MMFKICFIMNWKGKQAGKQVKRALSWSLLRLGNTYMGICYSVLSTFYTVETFHNKMFLKITILFLQPLKYPSQSEPDSCLPNNSYSLALSWKNPWFHPGVHSSANSPCDQGKVTPSPPPVLFVSANQSEPNLLTNHWFWKDTGCRRALLGLLRRFLCTLLGGCWKQHFSPARRKEVVPNAISSHATS